MRCFAPLMFLVIAAACSSGRPGNEQDLAGPGKDGGARDMTAADMMQVPPIAALTLDTLFENCMPIVMPDPLMVQGRVDIENVSSLRIGPLSAGTAEIYDKNDARIATFQLDDTSLNALKITLGPGELRQNLTIKKKAGSVMPQKGCSTVACNSSVYIVVPLSGTNVAAGSRIKSAPTILTCAQ